MLGPLTHLSRVHQRCPLGQHGSKRSSFDSCKAVPKNHSFHLHRAVGLDFKGGNVQMISDFMKVKVGT